MIKYISYEEQDFGLLKHFNGLDILYKNDKNVKFMLKEKDVKHHFLHVIKDNKDFAKMSKLNFNHFHFFFCTSNIKIVVLKLLDVSGDRYYSAEAYDSLKDALICYGAMLRGMGGFKNNKLLTQALNTHIKKMMIESVLKQDNEVHSSDMQDDDSFKL